MSQITPMMNQYLDIKKQHQDKLLFFRLGDFYELFFNDAVIASKELEITLTGRDCGLDERAPMCGVPYHAVDAYILKLIEKNYKVAICEQVEDPSIAKGIVKREVVRIITPGTVIDHLMLDEKKNNYILSLYHSENMTSLSYTDLSTGEFYNSFIESIYWSSILDEVNRINPAEILSNIQVEELSKNYNAFNILDKKYYSYDDCLKSIKNQYKIVDLLGLGLENEYQIKSSGALLIYLQETQKTFLSHINFMKIYNISSFMKLDLSTRKNLEICESLRDKSRKGTLLSVLDKTYTSMGGRKLRQWLDKPLISNKEILYRLDSVEELLNKYLVREDFKEYLKSVYDIERISTRISLKTANARDLIAFKNSIKCLPHVKKLACTCTSPFLKHFYNELDELMDLFDIINISLEDNPPIALKEGNLIKQNYSNEIDKLKEASLNGKQWILQLEQDERQKTGIKNLKIGYNKVFGYFIDITKSNISSVPGYFIRKQTLSNSERYITPELKELESTVLGAEEKLIELEYQTFLYIRDQIGAHISRIQKTSSLLAELDCLCSFAEVSQKNNYTKPTINDEHKIIIQEGRHPVVEKQNIDNTFIPNDTELDNDYNRIIIITGPNMAGKSTYMRQVALITFMAQIGCYVPAKEATIGIVDRIFTRVGASDDLASGRSTFMVEMSELANIINNATSKSLIILDEIGRGTSTFDGLSIAWAVIEYISDINKLGSKTLFSTHYHELTEIENIISGVKNYCISVEEIGKNIIFLRKIIRGGANGSYGIHVARLAGIPEQILERADEILSILEKSQKYNHKNVNVKKKKNKQNVNISNEFNLFNYNSYSIIQEINGLDINNLTPIQAFNKLIELKEKTKNI